MAGDQDPLTHLRVTIDEIDAQLVELLERRAEAVIAIGEHKRERGGAIYAPARESQVLAAALSRARAAGGRLPARTVEAVFREIMSGSFALELPLRIGYLGPPGSFSHQAAVAHFGRSVAYEDLRSIAGVFDEVRRGRVDYGLVPIENSTGGSVRETLDAFREHGAQLHIYTELVMAIRHALLARCQPNQVRRIRSKPEAFAQCRQFLVTQYPEAELVPAASTSAAVVEVREAYEAKGASGADGADEDTQAGHELGEAAIASSLAGQLHGVEALFESIEDDPNNLTRFVVLAPLKGRGQASDAPTPRSGDDKTSLMFTVRDEPGALVEVLACFARAGVNLSHIDKRPSGRETWAYTFFVDAHGHREDAEVQAAIAAVREHCREVIVLGSYPRAQRVL